MRSPAKCFPAALVAASTLVFLLLARPTASPGAVVAVESPASCAVCGMDRTAFARSRMLITYGDGGSAGLCSVHCAAAELKRSAGRPVASLRVADFATRELLDAGTAVWVVGGDLPGTMTSTAKWAFAGEVPAREFVAAHGGQVAPFDEVMALAAGEVADGGGMKHRPSMHAGHGGMRMGAGAQLVFNPAFGDQIHHTHPAGMWMLGYQFMRMGMSGLRDGTADVDADRVGYRRQLDYEYMMIPTQMTMDMHMLMAMYGVTDRWTVMVMPSYVETKMDMIMDMGPMMKRGPYAPMSTGGLGDTELRGACRLSDVLTASLGLSLPTGSIEETVTSMRSTFRAPYDMQLGSGSYDLRPAITYSALSTDARWNWGAQAQYTWRTAENANGWRYGDALRVNGWLQRALGPASGWLRLAGSNTGRIRGADAQIEALQAWSSMPDADPGNYGGTRVDGAVGAGVALGPASLGVELGVPLHQDLHGLQMKTTWFMTAGIQVMF